MATRMTTLEPRSGRRPTAKAGAVPEGYVVPLLHTRLPERVVDFGFWGGLLGAVALGAVDLPLAALVGIGVLVARHRRTH